MNGVDHNAAAVNVPADCCTVRAGLDVVRLADED